MIRLKNNKDIAELRISGSILAIVMKELKQKAGVGVKLIELDKIAKNLIRDFGAKPAFLGYISKSSRKPYPASICASVNDNIVHGIPNSYALKEGDVLKIDMGVSYHGFITDAAITVGIEKISSEAEKLIKATKRALDESIKICRLPKKIGDIGWIIENTVKNYGFSVVENLTGHGVGFELHEEPSIYNYGERGTGHLLEEGMVLAIEPMTSMGSSGIEEREDGSFVTKDGSLSAHFEKTIAITKHGPEILTPID